MKNSIPFSRINNANMQILIMKEKKVNEGCYKNNIK